MKNLCINLTNSIYAIPSERETFTLAELDGSKAFAERTDTVVVVTDRITKKLYNYIQSYNLLPNLEHLILVYRGRVLQGFDEIESFVTPILLNRLIENESRQERQELYHIQKEFNVPMEILINIDDYLSTELLNAYDITVGTTNQMYEKSNVYRPTDLQRKEWGITDEHFSFSRNKAKRGIRNVVTLKDKLLAYVTLQYYIDNGIIDPMYNETTTGNITRKHLNYCADVCGHAHPYQTNDDVQAFVDNYRLSLKL